jgi:ribosomal-protein-alanine N-acetyltransferase
MVNHGTIQLEIERLILRKFMVEDMEGCYLNWASDDKASKFFAFYPHSSRIETGDRNNLIICSIINAEFENE